jgi:hypothetical protein
MYILYLNYVPSFKERLTFLTEVANEFLFLIMCYHIVLFIGLIWDQKPKQRTGFSLLVFLALFFAGNVGVIIGVSVKGFIRGRKLKKYKQRRAKILSTRKNNIQMIQSAHIMNGLINFDKHRDTYLDNRQVFEQEIKFIKDMSNLELRNLLI